MDKLVISRFARNPSNAREHTDDVISEFQKIDDKALSNWAEMDEEQEQDPHSVAAESFENNFTIDELQDSVPEGDEPEIQTRSRRSVRFTDRFKQAAQSLGISQDYFVPV